MSSLTPADVRLLHNQPVFVLPGPSTDNPPVGMRGTIRITPEDDVTVILHYAVMFDRPAATQTILLGESQIHALFASFEANGDYTLRLDHPITPPPSVGYVVASPRL